MDELTATQPVNRSEHRFVDALTFTRRSPPREMMCCLARAPGTTLATFVAPFERTIGSSRSKAGYSVRTPASAGNSCLVANKGRAMRGGSALKARVPTP